MSKILYPTSKRQPIECPAPGRYSKVAEREYHGWAAVNKSLLSEVAKSPMHARWWLDNAGDDPTDAMRLGTLTHLAILEPDRFDALPVEVRLDWRKKEGHAQRDAIAAGHECVFDKEMAVIEVLRRNIRESYAARKVSSTPGERELSLVWEANGLPCKARADKICSGRAMVDLKTCRDASEVGFGYAIRDYGYANQAAHYLSGWEALTGERLRYFIIAAQTEPPYPVAVYLLDEDHIELGRRENEAAMDRLKQCLDTGVWPGPGDGGVVVSAPSKWAMQRGGLQ